MNRSKSHVYPEEKKNRVIQDLKSGNYKSYVDLGLRHEVNSKTVGRWAREVGIHAPRNGLGVYDDFDWTEVDKLLGKVPDTEIARRFDMGSTRVRLRRLKLEIPAMENYRNFDKQVELRPHFEFAGVQEYWQENYELQQLLNGWKRCAP